MTTEFTQFNLRPELEQAVVDLGYVTPTPIQSAMIPVMVTGIDVIGQAQTGTGKTAAFALPILNNLQSNSGDVQALVLVPTRELAIQVAGAFSDYSKHLGTRVLAVYGGQSYGLQISKLRRGIDIVVGTPGRLIDLMQKGVLDISAVRTVVLDEADEMLSMGFIEDMETILAETPAERQTALFSATMPPEIRNLADRYMNSPKTIAVQREQVTVDTITQRYYLVNREDKTAALTRLFEVEEITSALIFARTRMGTDELAAELASRGFPAEALNGDLSQDARERTMSRFRQGQLTVLVATDIAARGLDIDGISHVFNYDLPDDPEVYVHRIGRTGRAGKSGIAISLCTPGEKRRLREIEAFTRKRLERGTLPTEDEIRTGREAKLVNQLQVWLQRGRCRKERELAEKLVENGFDPMDIAAAAIKIVRGEEKQRPIAPVTEVMDYSRPTREFGRDRPRGRDWGRDQERGREFDRERGRGRESDRSERSPRWAQSSREPGMVRLSLDTGKEHGVRPNDIVGAIAFFADIPGSAIGKIQIQDSRSLVDVPEEFVPKVLAKTGTVKIRRQVINVQRA